MAQVGGNDVFCLKIVEIHVAMKKNDVGHSQISKCKRISAMNQTSLEVVSKWRQNGLKMAKIGGNGILMTKSCLVHFF